MRELILVVAAVVAASGCKKAPSFGQAVALTIKSSALGSDVQKNVRSLSMLVTGAEGFGPSTIPTPSGLKATDGTVYKPNASSGTLTFAITALSGNGDRVGYGTTTVDLVAGKTVQATVVLGKDVPALPDMAMGPDMKTVVDGGAVDAAESDGAVPADMTELPDLRELLDFAQPPGNHRAHYNTVAGGAPNISTTGTHKASISVGNVLSGKASGTNHSVGLGATRGSQP